MYRSLRNIEGVTVRVAPSFSTRDVIDGGVVVVTRAAAERIEAQWGQKLDAGAVALVDDITEALTTSAQDTDENVASENTPANQE